MRLRGTPHRSRRQFNFRDVEAHCGVPSNNQNNWGVGKILSDLAIEKGYPKDRPLTKKTDPCPTVNAPHCITHYPMEMFAEACERVRGAWNDKTRQFTMDF